MSLRTISNNNQRSRDEPVARLERALRETSMDDTVVGKTCTFSPGHFVSVVLGVGDSPSWSVNPAKQRAMTRGELDGMFASHNTLLITGASSVSDRALLINLRDGIAKLASNIVAYYTSRQRKLVLLFEAAQLSEDAPYTLLVSRLAPLAHKTYCVVDHLGAQSFPTEFLEGWARIGYTCMSPYEQNAIELLVLEPGITKELVTERARTVLDVYGSLPQYSVLETLRRIEEARAVAAGYVNSNWSTNGIVSVEVANAREAAAEEARRENEEDLYD